MQKQRNFKSFISMLKLDQVCDHISTTAQEDKI